MSNKGLFIALTLIALVSLAFLLQDDTTSPQSPTVETQASKETNTPISQSEEPENQPLKKEKQLQKENGFVTQSRPVVEEHKVHARDPHTLMSPAMIKWATRMGARMKSAKSDPRQVRPFFEDLTACSLSPDLLDSMRALCLQNARELSQIEPSLDKSIEQVMKDLPDKIIQLTKNL